MGVGSDLVPQLVASTATGQAECLGAESGRLLAALAQVAGGVGDTFENGAYDVAWRRV